MGRSHPRAVRRARESAALGILFAFAAATPAAAFEFFDGRLVVHGAFEQQIRALGRDMSTGDDIDLAQWYTVFGVETEFTAVEDGWGPIDLLSFFARFETRYDCVYTRGCGLFGGADAFGNRADHLPGRIVDAERSGFQGSVFVDDLGSYAGRIVRAEEDLRNGFGRAEFGPTNDRRPLLFSQLHRIDGLFEIAGPDQNFGAGEGPAGADDPAFFYFREVLDNCQFGSREIAGGDDGHGVQILGPINPKCRINPAGRLRNLPNPFRTGDLSPITGRGGTTELPYRPAPIYGFDEPAPRSAAQGVFYPSPAYRRLLDSGNLGDFDQNFRQAELEWNRGASQQDEKELKELYADVEMFDSRLWLRVGKQNIVWGKTELFRTTDQFNPTDLALATLPELEESRIPLWAVRGVWSFWSVGPFQDLRLELAANFDQFEPSDLGRCGEPFTVFAACNKTAGLFFHGITGFGLAGERRPQDPWNSLHGVEVGARLEFRLGRFSFQVMDFYGFEDRPYTDKIYDFERNVDPLSGRPRRANSRGTCVTGTEPACLRITSNILPNGDIPDPPPGEAGSVVDPASRQESLDNLSANLQLFTMICSTSIGFNAIDPAACGQTVFNSLNSPLSRTPEDRSVAKETLVVSGLLSNSLAGNTLAGGSILPLLVRRPDGGVVPPPFVRLNADPCDSFQTDGCPDKGDAPMSDFGGNPFYASGGPTLNQVLTDEQEALLGCGAFYGTDCEADGIDLANTEASVLMQAVVGFPGNSLDEWLTTNGLAQPGTTGFAGGPVATRYLGSAGVGILPGARGVADAGYDPLVDGCADGASPGCAGAMTLAIPSVDLLGNTLPDGGFGPSTGQAFASEMAAFSWNFQMLAAALSSPPDLEAPLLFPDTCPAGAPPDCLDVEPDEFDATRPFSTDPGQCSWAQPQFCGVLNSFFVVVGLQRNSVRAAGNGDFGRADFIWHSGGEAVLRYEKRNVMGFSMDFAEDFTKSNISVEAAWIEGQQFTDVNTRDGISDSDTLNLTVSVDRPTFINFLNDQRTFFFNTQWFFQYLPSYKRGFTSNGPFNVLATFSVNTGYFQDRLQPAVTFVYDKRSNSGAALPRVSYRFSSNFSATVGMNFFWGRFEQRDLPIQPISSIDNQVGRRAYTQGVENGLALVRDRDEAFLRIRYTF